MITAEDVDATLAKCSTEELWRIVDAAGPVPMTEWRQLTADQRRALRAQNLLNRRGRAAEQQASGQASQAEQQAAAARQLREARAERDLEPYIERKRQDYHRGW